MLLLCRSFYKGWRSDEVKVEKYIYNLGLTDNYDTVIDFFNEVSLIYGVVIDDTERFSQPEEGFPPGKWATNKYVSIFPSSAIHIWSIFAFLLPLTHTP